jgi:hypothetical protein
MEVKFMCCISNQQNGLCACQGNYQNRPLFENGPQVNQSCGCQGNFINKPVFWSKKKRISMLEDYLERMQEQVAGIEETIEELKK